MNIAIVAEITLTESTLATRRNVQKLLASTDLSVTARTSIQKVILTGNDEYGNLPTAELDLGNVPNFLHIAVTAPVRLTFFYEIGEQAFIDVTRHMTLTGQLNSVKIVNRSLTDTVTAKVITG